MEKKHLQLIKNILKEGFIDKEIKNIGKNSYFTKYEPTKLDVQFKLKLANAYIEALNRQECDPIFFVENYIHQEKIFYDAHEYYFEYIRDKFKSTIYTYLEEYFTKNKISNFQSYIEDIVTEIEEQSFEKVVEEIEANDKSTILDYVKKEKVEVPFIFGLQNNIQSSDLIFNYVGNVFSFENVIPDSKFLIFLKTLNMSVSEYIKAAENEFNVNLLNFLDDNNNEEWKIELSNLWKSLWDLENNDSVENLRQLKLNVGIIDTDEWNSIVNNIKIIKNIDLPILLDQKKIFNIMNNSTYGGNTIYVCQMSLYDLFSGKFDQSVSVSGGFIGIHDFINGSGYIEILKENLILDIKCGQWYIPSFRKEVVDDVYFITKSLYEIKSYNKLNQADLDFAHVNDKKWIHNFEDGYIEISEDNNQYTVKAFDKYASKYAYFDTNSFEKIEMAKEYAINELKNIHESKNLLKM